MTSVSALKLIQIRYFVAIVEAGSFVAAARELDVAQPALSRQIIVLEQELNIKLLHRVRRGATPTSAGKRFYIHARSVLDQLELAISDVHQDSDSPSGDVRVALSVGSASLIGPKLVQLVGARFPGVTVSIVDGLGYQTGDVIESGQVSFGLVAQAEALSGARVQPVLEEQLFLASRRNGSKADTRNIAFSKIVELELVMPDRRVHLRRMVEEAVSRRGLKLNVRYEQQSLLTILSLVKAGLGSVVIAWPAIQSMWEEGSIDARLIVEPELTRIISLAIPSSRPLSMAAKVTYNTLYELLQEEVREGNWKGVLLSEKT